MKLKVLASLLVAILLMYDPNSAFAASSGGRMGGSSFSSSSSSSRRSTKVYSYSYSRRYTTPYSHSSLSCSNSITLPSTTLYFLLLLLALLCYCYSPTYVNSVLKLQVGLLGSVRLLQKDLDRIAKTADTSTPKGLHYVLTESVQALLRHPDYCFSGYSSVDGGMSMKGAEGRFNQLSIEERGKVEEETLVNFNNMKKQSSTMLRAAGGFSNEYMVITVLVAVGGKYKLPRINSSRDLKEALQKLALIPSSRTLAVEVLWTPQEEDDTLSEQELLEDYPLLKPF